MKNLARAAALSLTTVLTLAGVSACGSDDSSAPATPPATSTSSDSSSAPTSPESTGDATDAGGTGSADALCAVFTNAPTDADPSDTDAVISQAHDLGDQLAAAGVPADMPEDAQKGLHDFTVLLQNVDSGNVTDLTDASDPSALFSGDEQSGLAFVQYITSNCGDAFGGTP